MYEEKNYATFSLEEFDKIDFTQLLEGSVEKLRISTDGTKLFIKWDGNQPEFLSTLETLEGPYTYTEILEIFSNKPLEGPYTYTQILDILSAPDWTTPIIENNS